MTIEHHQRHLSQFLAVNKGHLFGSVHSCGRLTYNSQDNNVTLRPGQTDPSQNSVQTKFATCIFLYISSFVIMYLPNLKGSYRQRQNDENITFGRNRTLSFQTKYQSKTSAGQTFRNIQT